VAPRRVLFVIRDRLGDSLHAFAIVQEYLALHPQDDVTVLMRRDYAELVRAEPGFALVRYRNAMQVMLWALGRRLFAKPFDALIVLRGFGPRIRDLGRLIRARRKIYLDGRFASVFPEYPQPLDDAAQEKHPIPLAAYRAAALYEPGLPMPAKLHLPSLSRLRAGQQPQFVGVCPLTGEKRKDLSQRDLERLLDHVARLEPGVPIKVFVRENRFGLYSVTGRKDCELVEYETLLNLLAYFARMKVYYGADSGLYHLASAMDIPATLLFGPTQPRRIVLPRQRALSIRLAVLGDRHCGVKACCTPACIAQAVANLSDAGPLPLEGPPAECPLRAFPANELQRNAELSFPLEEPPGRR
jgi:ADP-heptose:LPS heptosyltransferase